MPLIEMTLKTGETIKSQAGAMKWMDSHVEMETNLSGGVGGLFKRKLMGESAFLNYFRATRDGSRISFGHNFPGTIIPIDVSRQSIICQKRAFLCSTENVDLEITFQRRISAGFFGGEGFIMQRLNGHGTAFVELDGEAVVVDLGVGEAIKVETGSVGMYEDTVQMEVGMVKGFKNMLFGGEGLFITTLTGPGKVWIQTTPIQSLAAELSPYLRRNSSSN